MTTHVDTLPKAFIWRRLHSLTGMWLVLFLLEHLITNSQAALLLGDSGQGFVRMVNLIHNLPYLTVIEVTLLGLPILIHMIWGIQYSFQGKFNSYGSDGSKPHLKYSRNKAFTWQRITSWFLVVLLIMHVVKFRFLEYPETVHQGSESSYIVKVSMDPGLYSVADRLDVKLYDEAAIDKLKGKQNGKVERLFDKAEDIQSQETTEYNSKDAEVVQEAQKAKESQEMMYALSSLQLKQGEVAAVAPEFGTASLLNVRNTFKSPLWGTVYTLFVLSACFHAFNGLWTSMLTWGWVIRQASQTNARRVAFGLMAIIAFLGLAAVWGTYFLNLKT